MKAINIREGTMRRLLTRLRALVETTLLPVYTPLLLSTFAHGTLEQVITSSRRLKYVASGRKIPPITGVVSVNRAGVRFRKRVRHTPNLGLSVFANRVTVRTLTTSVVRVVSEPCWTVMVVLVTSSLQILPITNKYNNTCLAN